MTAAAAAGGRTGVGRPPTGGALTGGALTGGAPIGGPAITAGPPSRPRAMLAPVDTRSVSPVFVGRSDELDVLNDALSRAAAGEPQALLVGGEAGVGKTRLVEEFAATAGRGGAVVAVGGCVEIGADGLPFAPFSSALRALRRALPDEFAVAAAGQEDELARLLPECGQSTVGRHDEEGMARLFELVARLLERVAADRTVVLALEDLHWADASTRHLLSYLLRTLRTGRLVVVATYRADDIHRRHPLRPCSPSSTGCAPYGASNSLASPGTRSVARSPASWPANPTPSRSTPSSNAPTATPSSSRNSPSPRTRAAAPASPTPCATCSSSASRRCPTAPSTSPGSSPRAAPPSSTGCWTPSPGSPRTI